MIPWSIEHENFWISKTVIKENQFKWNQILFEKEWYLDWYVRMWFFFQLSNWNSELLWSLISFELYDLIFFELYNMFWEHSRACFLRIAFHFCHYHVLFHLSHRCVLDMESRWLDVPWKSIRRHWLGSKIVFFWTNNKCLIMTALLYLFYDL